MTRGIIGRIAADDKVIHIYKEPDYDSEIVRDTSFDELVHLYYELEIQDGGPSPGLLVPCLGWLSTGCIRATYPLSCQ